MNAFRKLTALTVLFLVSSAHAEFPSVTAVCNVSQIGPNSTAEKVVVQNKELKLVEGSGPQGAQVVANIDGLELKVSSPMTATVPVVLLEGKSSVQWAQAGRDISHPTSNFILLNVGSPATGFVAASCNLSLR